MEISEAHPGDIVLAVLPQRDGIRKSRPALLLQSMPPFGDFLACGVSSKLHQEARGFDEIILMEDYDFAKSGLLLPSLIRLGWLSTIPESMIEGSIGSISAHSLERVLKRLSDYLVK